MEKLSFEEFAKRELENWVYLFSTGKQLPSIVQKVLETAYKNYTRTPEEFKKAEEWLAEIKNK